MRLVMRILVPEEAVEEAVGVGRGYEMLMGLNETAKATVAEERESKRVWVVAVDTDGNGDPTNDDADGDDEDGITFGSPIMVGQLDASVTVRVQNAPSGARLDAWIDFNADGSWGGPFEQIADLVSISLSSAHRRYHRALSLLGDMMNGTLETSGQADEPGRRITDRSNARTGRA